MLFLLLVLLYVALRLWRLGDYGLDTDEVFSLQAARLNWSGLISFIVKDLVHPPFFYLLLKVWSGIGGESLWWLRLFPALTAIGALVPFWFLCRQLNLRAAEMNLALALMAVNAYLIGYAQYLRMYSLLLFLSLCSFWLFARFFNSGAGAGSKLLLLFAINLLLVYTHYYGLIIIGLEFLFLLLWGRSKLLAYTISAAIIGLAFIPWIYAVSQAAKLKRGLTQNLDWITRPHLPDLMWFYATLNGLFQFRRSTSVGLLLFGFPIMVWLWRALKDRREEDSRSLPVLCWLLMCAFLPAIIAFCASQFLPQSVWGERHLIIVAMPYMTLVAVAVMRLRPPWAMGATLLLVIGWAAVAGFHELTRHDKRLAWDALAHSMIQAESSQASGIEVYALEEFVATPLRHSLDAAQEKRFKVVTSPDIAAFDGDHFWVAYRDTTWKQERLPEQILTDHGYKVGPVFSSRMTGQQVNLFPVWRQ